MRRMEPPGIAQALCPVLTVLLLFATAPSLVSATPPDGPPKSLHDATVLVDATVIDNYATVDYKISLHTDATAQEVHLGVPVPDDAYVSGLTLERNGTAYPSQIQPQDDARDTYDAATARGQSASLVETQRGSTLHAYRLHAGPHTTLNATLTYERYLPADQSLTHLHLPAPRLANHTPETLRFQATLDHVGGIQDPHASPEATIERHPHGVEIARTVHGDEATPPTNLTLRYRVAETPPGGLVETAIHNGTGYFVHRLHAHASTHQLPLDLALVLDTSGSMTGLKIDQLREAAHAVVNALSPEDRLHITLFDTDTHTPWKTLRPLDADTANQARFTIDQIHASGSTNIEQALSDAFRAFPNATNQERLPVVAFLTDGRATTGTTDEAALRTLAQEGNRVDASVYGLAFGERADWGLVHGLADDANGTAVHVESGHGAGQDIERFLTALTTPVLKDLHVHYEGNVTPLHTSSTTLFAGSELLILGTFDPEMPSLRASLEAQAPNGTVSWELDEPIRHENATHVPRTVAVHRLHALQDRLSAHGSNATLEREARELALEHGFVTEHTSLVVTLPPRNGSHEEDATPNRTLPDVSVPIPPDLAPAATTALDNDAAVPSSGSSSPDEALEETSRFTSDEEGSPDPALETPAAPVVAWLAGLAATSMARARLGRARSHPAQVDDRVHEDPHEVHEVPVDRGALHEHVPVGVELVMHERPVRDHDQRHQARDHVQAVRAREHVEGCREVAVRERHALAEEGQVLGGLAADEDRAQEDRKHKVALERPPVPRSQGRVRPVHGGPA